MNKFDRIFELQKLFKSRRCYINISEIKKELECSTATAKRIIGKLRDELGVPINYDRKNNGYILDRTDDGQVELPGLWFNLNELQSLLTLHDLLTHMQPGLLRQELSGFKQRIEQILRNKNLSTDEVSRRFRFFSVGARLCPPANFHKVASATLQRKKIEITYHARGEDTFTKRMASPQRLIFYRNNWYLDIWCHLKEGFRTLAIDRIQKLVILDTAAKDIPDEELDRHFRDSFGIFSGAATKTAVLVFTSHRARWVAEEQWHPKQQGRWLPDGRYELRLPCGDLRELVLDILRYSPDVEVLAPEELRNAVIENLVASLKLYKEKKR